MKPPSDRPTAVDLFCGAGGLTLGLKRAGFRVVAGLEISPEIAKTYKANHPEVVLLTKDVRQVSGREIRRATGEAAIDLVAGCPPCQGFSKLTDKYHRLDPRNDLVLEMARVVTELRPRIVMMENVAGLARRGRPTLNRFIRNLRDVGYSVDFGVLQVANYGIPQSRRRLVLLAANGIEISLPAQTHSFRGDDKRGLKPWLTLQDAIGLMKDRPVTLSRAIRNGGPLRYRWHVVRDLEDISKARLRALRAGGSRRSLPKSLRPACHVAKDEGFSNVYGRLRWRMTPPTITSGCTTPCKGRFGHPSQLRTISVREAALIQTFPKSYKFKTDYMDVACDLVGNALPPKFARIVARQCMYALKPRFHGCG